MEKEEKEHYRQLKIRINTYREISRFFGHADPPVRHVSYKRITEKKKT